jgi:uncharacterized protein YndB with AHSA1/START domain
MEPTIEPGPLAQVSAVATRDGWTLVFVRDLRHPPERVWAALTDPAQLNEWSPFTSDRDLGRVGDATLTMIDGDTSEAMASSVLVAEPPTVLEYTWGDDVVRWELARSGDGTRLTLRHAVGQRDLLAKVAAGWHLCLLVAEHLMDGQAVGPIRGEDAKRHGWDALHDAYAQELDAET